jgi:hypothetical protein
MNKEKLKQDPLDSLKKFIRQSISIAIMTVVAATASGDLKKGFRMNTAAAMTVTMTDTETAELAEVAEVAKSTVSFSIPDILSTLPDVVSVEQGATIKVVESGQVFGGIEIFTNGVWQEVCPSFLLGSINSGEIGQATMHTDPGDITSSGLYRFTLSFVPDGGGPTIVFNNDKDSKTFEIVDPNAVVDPDPVDPVDIPSFDPATGVLNLPSVEIDGLILKNVNIQLNSDGSYKVISYEN